MSLSHPDEIRASARVIELMRDNACRVELPNGHRAVGQSRTQQFALDDQVTIAFHPYDLARGWIVAQDKEFLLARMHSIRGD